MASAGYGTYNVSGSAILAAMDKAIAASGMILIPTSNGQRISVFSKGID